MRNSITSWKFSKGNAGTDYGQLKLTNYVKEENYAFVDYLRGGMDINLITCIDFTGSNGVIHSPLSLHYCSPNADAQLNQYQQAIQSVGNILLEYDSDKLIPVYGFGAKPLELIQGGKLFIIFLV
jgi:Copine